MRIGPKLTGSARVVAWVYAIFGAAVPIVLFGLLSEGESSGAIVGVLAVEMLFLVAGVGILRGARWAWWLAVGLTAFYVISSLVVALDDVIPGIIGAAVFAMAFAGLVVPTRRGTPEASRDQTMPPPPPSPPGVGLSDVQDDAPPSGS
jgi:hypothetical protein